MQGGPSRPIFLQRKFIAWLFPARLNEFSSYRKHLVKPQMRGLSPGGRPPRWVVARQKAALLLGQETTFIWMNTFLVFLTRVKSPSLPGFAWGLESSNPKSSQKTSSSHPHPRETNPAKQEGFTWLPIQDPNRWAARPAPHQVRALPRYKEGLEVRKLSLHGHPAAGTGVSIKPPWVWALDL